MILTVTPNAAVDKTYRIEGFRMDCVNRPSESFTVAGGKGINVARVYQTLGGKAVASGFLGGINGKIVADAMAAEKIDSDFVQVSGESRTCIAVIDPLTGSQTEVNENGPRVSPQNAHDLLTRVDKLLCEEDFDFVVMSGSLPPGAPEDLYAQLISVCRSHKVRSVLDASGAPLAKGVAAVPWMVKPNQPELASLVGKPLNEPADYASAIQSLLKSGIAVVAATRGSRGAMAGDAAQMWHAAPPPIKFASAVASGDSFLAAFLYSWLMDEKRQGASKASCLEAALRLGTGAGAANAAVIGAGFCTRDSIYDAAHGAKMTLLDGPSV